MSSDSFTDPAHDQEPPAADPSTNSPSAIPAPPNANFLKRPLSPSSESSASKRALSEDPDFYGSELGPSCQSKATGGHSSSPSVCGTFAREDSLAVGASHLHLDNTIASVPPAQLAGVPARSPAPASSGQTTPTSSQAFPGGREAFHFNVNMHNPTAPPSPSTTTAAAVPIGPAPMPSEQYPLFKDAQGSKGLNKGDIWFLVSRSWYRRWLAACNAATEDVQPVEKDAMEVVISVDEVGPIDNSAVLDGSGELKRGVQAGVDVEMVSTEGWRLLKAWYALKEAGHEIGREVIAPSGLGSETVEFYPPTFTFIVLPRTGGSDDTSAPPPSPLAASSKVKVSIGRTVADLKAIVRRIFTPPIESPIRFWRIADPPELIDAADDADLNLAMLTDPEITLGVDYQDSSGQWAPAPPVPSSAASTNADADADVEGDPAPLFSGQGWLDKMEKQNETNFLNPRYRSGKVNGVPISPSDPTAGTSTAEAGRAKEKEKDKEGFAGGLVNRLRSSTRLGPGQSRVRGLVGLQNLGNTCFMNSALQCLSNCPELKAYFLSKVYLDEFSVNNPLSHNGQVARAYGQLMERLWDPRAPASIAPRELKMVIGKCASQFLGYGQQDAQELVAYLLDALHEDLNRVRVKKTGEAPDWNGGGPEAMQELAEASWNLYMGRNDSVIVDLFQGQYMSTLTCPDCGKVAIKLDEVQYLTLDLSTNKKFQGTVLWVPLDVTKPLASVTFEVPAYASIRDVKRHLGKLLDADPAKMAVLEDWHGRPWKVWNDTETVESISASDIITVYETPDTFASLSTGTFRGDSAPLIVPVIHTRNTGGTLLGRRSQEWAGRSFVLALTPEEACDAEAIYEALVRQYARRSQKAEELYYDPHTFTELNPSTLPRPSSPTTGEGTEGGEPGEPSTVGSTPLDTENGDIGAAPLDPISAEDSAALDVPPSRRLKPRPGMFKINVPERPQPKFPVSSNMSGQRASLTGRTLGQGSSAFASASGSKLPGAFSADDSDDLYGDAEPATEVPLPSVDAKPDSPIEEPPKPLVVYGDFIECDWRIDAWKEFLGEPDQADSQWADPVELVDPGVTARLNAAKHNNRGTTLDDCLRRLRTPEVLGEDDKWYCPVCKDHVQATKTMQLWKVPDILVIHFKRFSSARTYGRSSKVDTFVDFPIEGLDLSEEVEGVKVAREVNKKSREASLAARAEGQDVIIEEPEEESLVYDLFGVCNHYGGLGGGHYTAYAKNEEDGKWHDFNDSSVSTVSKDSIKTAAAYLLFYRRRTSKVLGAKTHEIVTSAMQSRDPSAAPSEHGGTDSSPLPDADHTVELSHGFDNDGPMVNMRPAVFNPVGVPSARFSFGGSGPAFNLVKTAGAGGSDGSVSPPSSGGRATPSSSGRGSPIDPLMGWGNEDVQVLPPAYEPSEPVHEIALDDWKNLQAGAGEGE